MNDLDLLIAGAMVSFLSVAAAYIAIRHRANEAPVRSYHPPDERPHPTVSAQPQESANPR